MSFGVSVHATRRRRKGRTAYPPAHHASVRVVVGDTFGTFVREIVLSRQWRVTVVSPWISSEAREGNSLDRLLSHLERCSAALVVITRPPRDSAHQQALDKILRLPRARVVLNPSLHAKLYLGEERGGRGIAVIGSGNATTSSTTLDEAAVLIRPARGSRIIPHLACTTVHQLSSGSVSLNRRHTAPGGES